MKRYICAVLLMLVTTNLYAQSPYERQIEREAQARQQEDAMRDQQRRQTDLENRLMRIEQEAKQQDYDRRVDEIQAGR